MTKGTKTIIGVSVVLMLGAIATALILKSRNKGEDSKDWEEEFGDNTPSGNSGGGDSQTGIDNETKRKNNFEAVKRYFGSSAAVYGDRIVLKSNASALSRMVGKTPADFGATGNLQIAVVFWSSGAFTVKVGNTIAAIKGLYDNGGKTIVITKGKGRFANKVGLRETDTNPLRAIARGILR